MESVSLAAFPHARGEIHLSTVFTLILVVGVGAAIVFLVVAAPLVGQEKVKSVFDRSEDWNRLWKNLNIWVDKNIRAVSKNQLQQQNFKRGYRGWPKQVTAFTFLLFFGCQKTTKKTQKIRKTNQNSLETSTGLKGINAIFIAKKKDFFHGFGKAPAVD